MSLKRILVYIAVGIFVVVCVSIVLSSKDTLFKRPQDKQRGSSPTVAVKSVGDRSVYGLACEGCNDTVVYLLPNNNSDPITFNILDATRHHRVLGNLKIGDRIAVVPDSLDKTKGDIVVDIEQLQGIWCYIVMPKLRDFQNMSNRAQAKQLEAMPDSVKRTYYIPREYGFWLRNNGVAESVGYVPQKSALEDESPVVYQPLGYFVNWQIWNGKFIMTSGSPSYDKDGKVTVKDLVGDTCTIDFLSDDSLVLSDRDGSRSYYKKNSITEVNQKAKKIAEELSKKALAEMQQ